MEKSQFSFQATFKPTKRILKVGGQSGISACPSYLCVYFFFIYRETFNCRFQLNCVYNRKLCGIVYLVILSNETQASKSKYGKNIRTGGKPEILRWV